MHRTQNILILRTFYSDDIQLFECSQSYSIYLFFVAGDSYRQSKQELVLKKIIKKRQTKKSWHTYEKRVVIDMNK